MKTLLIFTGILEAVTGATFLIVPALDVSLLLGRGLDAPVPFVVAHLAGAALLSLGVACLFASRDTKSRAVRGIVVAMSIYNVAAVALLADAGFHAGLAGIVFWPAVILHAGLAAWCVGCLLTRDPSPVPVVRVPDGA